MDNINGRAELVDPMVVLRYEQSSFLLASRLGKT